ncbi:MAG: hypothetical protein WCP29_04400 [Acidobacteriota bacterium]
MTWLDRQPRRDVALAAGAAVVVVGLTVAAYWPALDGGFVSDDFLVLRRVADLGGLRNAAAYFGLRHFEYFRPVAFLSFAADWQLWGRSPAGYHATALCLHALNALLVFVLSRRLMGTWAALAAASLFALHPSNHEAVFWVSARFDLLATAWMLTGLYVLRWRSWTGDTLAAAAFLGAVLSKESALAFPVVAGAYLVLLRGSDGRRWLRQLGLLAVSGAAYAWLRHGAGLASAGGAARLPKLGALAGFLALLLIVAQLGWARTWSVLGLHRRRVRIALAAAIGVIGLLAAGGPGAAMVRGWLTSLAFAALHLASPFALDWAVGTLPSAMWAGGLAVLVVLAGTLAVGWRSIEREPRAAWLIAFLAAALVPVSSMTEGTRYLYVACVPAAMLVGVALDSLRPRRRVAAGVLVVAVLGINSWQVRAKAADWTWAARMTAAAADTISASSDDHCDDRDILLVTAPVRVRGVYANINLEGLEWLRGCIPASFNTIIRVGIADAHVAPRWVDSSTLEIGAPAYRGDFVTSNDFRTFDVAVPAGDPTTLINPVGAFDARVTGGDLVVRQSIAFENRAPTRRWFYFSSGALHALNGPVR